MANGAETTNIIGTAITTVAGIYIAANDAAENRKLQERLEKLSMQQQHEIAKKQLAAKTEVEKMNILYQALAVVKNNEAIAGLAKVKYTGIIVLGVGLTLLGVIIVMARKKIR